MSTQRSNLLWILIGASLVGASAAWVYRKKSTQAPPKTVSESKKSHEKEVKKSEIPQKPKVNRDDLHSALRIVHHNYPRFMNQLVRTLANYRKALRNEAEDSATLYATRAMEDLQTYYSMISRAYAQDQDEIEDVTSYVDDARFLRCLKQMANQYLSYKLKHFTKKARGKSPKDIERLSVFPKRCTRAAEERLRLAMHLPTLRLQTNLRLVQTEILSLLTQRQAILGQTSPKVYEALMLEQAEADAEAKKEAEGVSTTTTSTGLQIEVVSDDEEKDTTSTSAKKPMSEEKLARGRLISSLGAFIASGAYRVLKPNQSDTVKPLAEQEEKELLVEVLKGLERLDIASDGESGEADSHANDYLNEPLFERLCTLAPRLELCLAETRVLCALYMMGYVVNTWSREVMTDTLSAEQKAKMKLIIKLTELSEMEKSLLQSQFQVKFHHYRADIALNVGSRKELMESLSFLENYVAKESDPDLNALVASIFAVALHTGRWQTMFKWLDTYSDDLAPMLEQFHMISASAPIIPDYLVVTSIAKDKPWVVQKDVKLSTKKVSATYSALQWYSLRIRRVMLRPRESGAGGAWRLHDTVKGGMLRSKGVIMTMPSLSGLPRSLNGIRRAGTIALQSMVEPPGQREAIQDAKLRGVAPPPFTYMCETLGLRLISVQRHPRRNLAIARYVGVWSVENVSNGAAATGFKFDVEILVDVPEHLIRHFLATLKAQENASSENDTVDATTTANSASNLPTTERQDPTELLERAKKLESTLDGMKKEELRIIQEITKTSAAAQLTAPLSRPSVAKQAASAQSSKNTSSSHNRLTDSRRSGRHSKLSQHSKHFKTAEATRSAKSAQSTSNTALNQGVTGESQTNKIEELD